MFGSYPHDCSRNIFSIYWSIMTARISKKGIDENMTTGELAIMMNNSMNTIMSLIREMQEEMKIFKIETKKGFDTVRVDIDKRFHVAQAAMDKRFERVEIRLDRIEDRLDNIEGNMVNKFEFKTLSYRVDKLEERTR